MTRPAEEAILYVTPRYPPESGGTEIHAREVARRMPGLGFDVAVLSTRRDRTLPRFTRDGAVPVRRVRAWPARRDYHAAPALVREIAASGADLVHCQGYHTLVAPLALAAARRAGIPYVVTLHSGGHSSAARTRARSAQASLLRTLLLGAKALIAVSAFEADLFARRLRTGRQRFTVIPSGVDLPRPATAARAEPLVASIGRVERYKGHHRVVEALPLLLRTRPDLRLRIVGSGPHAPELRALAARLGVADRVEIAPLPAGDRAAVGEVLGAALAVVTLSEYESQGLAAQEALALGRPLVASTAAALGEIARLPGVEAVSPGADAAAVAGAIEKAIERGPVPPPPLPTWDECARGLAELYRSVLA